jgi:hypothetical protein
MEEYWRTQYEAQMCAGAREYADVLQELNELGLPAEFTQTGGMNAAIEVQLETGAHLLITDAEDSLAWRREEQRGWSVGLYRDPERTDGPAAFQMSESADLKTLISLIKSVMQPPKPL